MLWCNLSNLVQENDVSLTFVIMVLVVNLWLLENWMKISLKLRLRFKGHGLDLRCTQRLAQRPRERALRGLCTTAAQFIDPTNDRRITHTKTCWKVDQDCGTKTVIRMNETNRPQVEQILVWVRNVGGHVPISLTPSPLSPRRALVEASQASTFESQLPCPCTQCTPSVNARASPIQAT